ncbi:nesprin-2 isoform X4 [Oryzias latipes]|uniref:nesprin-2 isoform X4 n=1 Tax=Oryzias latipes TaxID=8090 RepID=UPI000CE1AF6A|nr:nesprin-2 isoform X4 [Oryzias latipes]
MLNQIEDLKENMEQMDSNPKSADISLLSVKSGSDGNPCFKNTETENLDFKDDVSRGFSPKTADAPQTATASVTEVPFDNAAPDSHAPSTTAELLSICPHVDVRAGDTRLIPFRPKTPIMADGSSEESRQMLNLLDELEQSEIFPTLKAVKDTPSLEFFHGGCLRRRAGRGTEIQQAARALLQGAARLLDLREGFFVEKPVTNHSKLKAVSSRHKKLLQVFSCQLSFAQHLFQREPKTLEGQEDERVQLETRYKALLQPALQQDASSQMLLQECWEECCARLGEALDEAGGGGRELEGDGEEEEEEVQRRLDACEQTLHRLQDSRAVLGLLLDLETLLQADPTSAASVRPAGGVLELRWRSACRKAEREVQCCRKIRDGRVRFQTGLDSLSDRQQEASERMKALAALAGPSHQDPDFVQSSLLKLLDFSMEMEAVSTLRASVSQDAGHLKHADARRLHLNELEVGWSQMTSDLSMMQEHLLQLAVWPPLNLLSGMEDRRKSMEVQLHQKKERLHKTQNAAEVTEILQQYQGLKAAAARVVFLLDFLSQPESGIMGTDLQALFSERMAFAEEFGAIRFRWLLFQTELKTQTCEAEQLRRTCAERERHLQGLCSWIQLQEEQLDQVKRSGSQSLTQKALLEWEEKEKEVSAALQGMKIRKESDDLEEKHLSDVVFSDQVESVTHAFEELCSQVEALRWVLQRTTEDWALFQNHLQDVTLLACRLRFSLQLQRAPVFSLKQAEEESDLLQDLQVKAMEWGGLWAAVDKSYQRLAASRPPAATQVLSHSLEAEPKRWKDVVQEIQDKYLKTRRMISLWQKYSQVSDSCFSHLQLLWHEWDRASSNQQNPEASVCLLESAANELQSTVGDVLMASKPLLDWLDPCAANLIHSETRLLSRDVLLLKQAVLAQKRSLEIHLQQQNLFQAQLEALEKQMQNLVHKVQTPVNDTDSAKELLQELSALLPSLVEIKETSQDVVLNNQERLQELCRRWRDSMTQASHLYRRLHEELQRSRSFEENLKNLKSIQEELERETLCMKTTTSMTLQEMLVAQQQLQAEISVGHQLLQDLLCHNVQPAGKSEDRSELVTSVKKSWLTSVLGNEQNWTSIKQCLHQWKVYQCGTALLQRLFETLEAVLPLTGLSLYSLEQLQSCTNLLQCVEKSVGQHIAVYTQTVGAADHLLEIIPEWEGRTRLKAELQETKEMWQKTTLLLRRNQELVDTAIQMWAQCQDGITEVESELDNVKQRLAENFEEFKETGVIQEMELCLQRSSAGLRESASIRTRLSQHVAASDAAVLEQQLEQLHAQWEELCVKVSLRKQEIADRLNAWTIFNDKNREFSDWLTQMEKKIYHTGDLSIEEMVEKLKKDCMEEMNLFSENKSHLKQLGEQLLLASDEAKQTQVRGSLQEVNQRWNDLFHHIGARVKKLKETLVTVEQLDKNMSNLRSWLSRVEAELSRPITYSVCHQREIQRRLAEQQALQEDVEQHAEAVASVLSLCGVLLQDEDAAAGTQAETDSLQETSHSLDQRWTTICTLALDRRLRVEETWTLWCKFLNDYSCFEDWLKIAETTAANPNSADVPFTLAKEELVKFEGIQRQVNERLTQLEILNNQYRRLARESRTDRAGQLQAMVREGNRRWDLLHRRVTSILRRLRHFTGQREEFEGTRKSMLVWLTELDLQLTNVEHFSESDVHHKIQQLNSFQKEITLNTERIDGLIVFGEGLIKKSSPQDAELIEDELEELHSYCQEVFSRLVRFHQRLSRHVIRQEPEPSGVTFSLESSLELIGRPWLGRSQGSLPATPTHLLTSPLERSGRETPVSVDSLPLEWDHTGDVGSSSHEDDEDDEEEGPAYFTALSGGSPQVLQCPGWQTSGEQELDAEDHGVTTPTLSSTPLKPAYLRLTSQCSGSIQNLKRVSLILDDEEQLEEFGLTGLAPSDQQSAGVIERWELVRAQSRQQAGPQEPQQLTSDLDDITSWLEAVIPELELLQQSDPAASISDMEDRAKEIKEMQKMFAHYKSTMLSLNLQAEEAPDRLMAVNREWSRASTALQQWDCSLRKTLMRCQEFHESLHSLLLWLPHGESRRYTVDINHPGTTAGALGRHYSTLSELQEELRVRQTQQAALQALWSQLQPEDGLEGREDTQQKLHVTGSKLQLLQRQVEEDLCALRQHLDSAAVAVQSGGGGGVEASPDDRRSEKQLSSQRRPSPPRSFFLRVLRAAFPLQLLLLLLLLLPCLIPLSEGEPGCTLTNNFARSFYPMLHYTNGPPPT